MTTIVLSSDPAVKKSAVNKPENFTTFMNRPIQLQQNKKYEIGMLSMNASYSWHNIENSRSNTLIKYRIDGVSPWKDISFPEGIYSYKDINNVIQDTMILNGDATEVLQNINLEFNLSTLKVIIVCLGSYELDLVSSGFGSLIGFDHTVIVSETKTSTSSPNITNSLENIYIHCSLVTDSIVDGFAGDVLYTFSTSTLFRSYPFEFAPTNLLFHPLNTYNITNIRMYMTDNNERLIDFNDVPTSFTLIIRERKE